MAKMTYVNIHGQPVEPDYLPRALPTMKAPAIKRVHDQKKATAHFGFEVVGISQAALDEAKRLHVLKHKERGTAAPLFDVEAWLNKTKPKRAIRRVFQVPSAADQAAGMLLAGGVGIGFGSSRS